MSNLIVQGLIISLAGMSLTFLALGIVILAIVLLNRIFRVKKATEPAEAVTKEQITVTVRDSENEEIAAVITTAVAYWRYKSQSRLGLTLEAGRSAWWVTGRARQSPAEALQRIKERS